MSNIVGLDGKPVGGASPPTPQTGEREPHTYRITKQNGTAVEINGILFVTPVFIAIGNEKTGEFIYIVPFEFIADVVNVDGIENGVS